MCSGAAVLRNTPVMHAHTLTHRSAAVGILLF